MANHFFAEMVSGKDFYSVDKYRSQMPDTFADVCYEGVPMTVEDIGLHLAKAISNYRRDCYDVVSASKSAERDVVGIGGITSTEKAIERNTQTASDISAEIARLQGMAESTNDQLERMKIYNKLANMADKAHDTAQSIRKSEINNQKSHEAYVGHNATAEESRQLIPGDISELQSSMSISKKVEDFCDPYGIDESKIADAIDTGMSSSSEEARESMKKAVIHYSRMRASVFKTLIAAGDTYLSEYSDRRLAPELDIDYKTGVALDCLRSFTLHGAFTEDSWYVDDPLAISNVDSLCEAMDYATAYLNGESINRENVANFASNSDAGRVQNVLMDIAKSPEQVPTVTKPGPSK